MDFLRDPCRNYLSNFKFHKWLSWLWVHGEIIVGISGGTLGIILVEIRRLIPGETLNSMRNHLKNICRKSYLSSESIIVYNFVRKQRSKAGMPISSSSGHRKYKGSFKNDVHCWWKGVEKSVTIRVWGIGKSMREGRGFLLIPKNDRPQHFILAL